MAYNATYTSSDAAPIMIDTGAKIVVAMAAFAGILGLIVAWHFMKKLAKK